MSCFENGRNVENIFKKSVSSILDAKGIDYTIEKTPATIDINNHIDFYLKYGDNTRSFDVKSMKKINRYDDELSDFNWIELVNVYGNKGWLYGEATHIAFETQDGFMLVKRKKLAEMIESKCKDSLIVEKTFKTKTEPYKMYKRKNRNDVIVLIPNKDINEIKETYIKKVL